MRIGLLFTYCLMTTSTMSGMRQEPTDSITRQSEKDDSLRLTLVVVDAEFKRPVRDIAIATDNGQETKSRWDGTFTLLPDFERIYLRHPDFQQRYVLKEELRGDTIRLLPREKRLGEVVIYGIDRSRDKQSNLLGISERQQMDYTLQALSPHGPDVIAMAIWGFDKLFGKKIARKKALKKVREREAEVAEHFNEILQPKK